MTTSTSPLILTGSSYLMPTLRLDRRDNPASLQVKMAQALKQPAPSASVAGVKSMLRGKATRSGQWTVPIVLDLAALVPDGSPHYVKPEPGLLVGVVDCLRDFGIVVVGVTNTPRELETEAIQQLGLPSLMSKGVLNSTTLKVRLEEVVQMVLAKEAQYERPAKEIETSATTSPKFEAAPIHEEPKEVPKVEITVTPNEQPKDTPPPPQHTNLPTNSFVYYGSVRSGQTVTADTGQALVVIGSVNSGGEVLSDGDIYVFGKLRGRALAGLACAKDTKIMATSFDPELICIGDTFTTVDDVTEFGLKRPEVAAMVSLSPSGELLVEEITL